MYFFFYDDQIDALYLAQGTMEDLLNYPYKSVFDRFIWFTADITED